MLLYLKLRLLIEKGTYVLFRSTIIKVLFSSGIPFIIILKLWLGPSYRLLIVLYILTLKFINLPMIRPITNHVWIKHALYTHTHTHTHPHTHTHTPIKHHACVLMQALTGYHSHLKTSTKTLFRILHSMTPFTVTKSNINYMLKNIQHANKDVLLISKPYVVYMYIMWSGAGK